MIKIADCVDISNGYAFESSNYVEGGIRVMRITNVQKGQIIDDAPKFYPKETQGDLNNFLIQPDDILMSLTGNVGRVGLFPKELCPAYLNQRVARLRVTDDRLHNKYLFYVLNSDKFERDAIHNSSGIAQLNLSTKWVANYEIPLPPLDQQKKIAAILDAADTYRQKTKALIAKYDELAQSLFLEMFGDTKGNKVSLCELCEINPKKSEISALNKNTLVSFVPMANVKEDGVLTLDTDRPISEVYSGFTYFKENDVVFAKITPCMENGKGAIMRGLTNGIGFGTTEFHVLRPILGKSTAEFLFTLTHLSHFRKQAELNMTGSAGQKRVPKEFLSNYEIKVPTVELQNKFAERLQSITKQKELAQKSLDKAEELFNSLLQRAFKGELE